MNKYLRFVLYTLAIIFSFISFAFLPVNQQISSKNIEENQSENHAPQVKILSPKNNSFFSAGAQIPYRISVSDKEDGESKYQEINPEEVFLEIKYVKDSADAKELFAKNKEKDEEGLALIKNSNCLNCHEFNAKKIGPSFYNLIQHYKWNPSIPDSLADHILNGSKGRWGSVQMPSNNKLNLEEAKKIVNWLYKNAGDSLLSFLAGTSGSFKLKTNSSLKEAVLIATYTDHGTKDDPSSKLKGEDDIIIHIR
ncbi:MAG TPA: c-type cytochrome [Hanamia sp.]|nr:c-type cytochrome [Hanamia sp.]